MPVTSVGLDSERKVISKFTREFTQERSPTPVTSVGLGSVRSVI